MLSAGKLLSSGVLEKAEALLQAALEKEPRNIVMLERLGETCRQLGKFKKAGEALIA